MPEPANPFTYTIPQPPTGFKYPTSDVVTGLVPNTEYTCYAIRQKEAKGTGVISSASAKTTTNVAPPYVSASLGTDRLRSVKVELSPTEQGDARQLTYKVQCLEANGAQSCKEDGPWFDQGEIADLIPNQEYKCFGAAIYKESDTTEHYVCSDPSKLVTTDVEPPTIGQASSGEQTTTMIAVSGELAKQGNARELHYVVQCLPVGADSCSKQSSDWSMGNQDGWGVRGALTPNTNYECFAAVAWYLDSEAHYACSEKSNAHATAVAPPSNVQAGPTDGPTSVAGENSITVNSQPAIQGTHVPISNVVQCIEDSEEIISCNPAGQWQAGASSDVTNGGAMPPNTNFKCFAATKYTKDGQDQYVCSSAVEATTNVAAPTVGDGLQDGNPGAALNQCHPSTEMDLSGSKSNGQAREVAYTFACQEGSSAPPCTDASSWEPIVDISIITAANLSPSTPFTCALASVWDNGASSKCSPTNTVTTSSADPASCTDTNGPAEVEVETPAPPPLPVFEVDNGVVKCGSVDPWTKGTATINGEEKIFTAVQNVNWAGFEGSDEEFEVLVSTSCTSKVNSFQRAFADRPNFNGDISHFDLSGVPNLLDSDNAEHFKNMFKNAVSFTQDLTAWNSWTKNKCKPDGFDAGTSTEWTNKPEWKAASQCSAVTGGNGKGNGNNN